MAQEGFLAILLFPKRITPMYCAVGDVICINVEHNAFQMACVNWKPNEINYHHSDVG